MNGLHVDLENCYGIKALSHRFDFSTARAFAIYAPNGAMKSSLAETFKDVADGKPSVDRVFPKRTTKRTITDETGADLAADAVIVIRNYEDVFACTEETSTLLVDQQLRQQYQTLHKDLRRSTDDILGALRKQSKSKKDFAVEISRSFTDREDSFLPALLRLRNEIPMPAPPFADVPYDTIFNEKVLEVLATKDFKSAIASYVTRYNELLSASTFFKQGFDYWNASQVAKALADNGFFAAHHTVMLNGTTAREVKDEKELESLVDHELRTWAEDPTIQKSVADLKKHLEKNQAVRDFRAYISNRLDILPHLANIEALRRDVLRSYLSVQKAAYERVVSEYQRVQKEAAGIEATASQQRSQWQEAIEIFNRRFFVPFKLHVANQVAVTLGADKIPSLGFTFHDGPDSAPMEREQLVSVLSTGEKKALYILNLVFEIEVRKKAKKETLFVVDDVADSFDYKNKYAIVQYLKDIGEEAFFKQLILTHNFDFFRTIQSRALVQYGNCFAATRSAGAIVLGPARGIRNPFVLDWKPKFLTDDVRKIACIPFMRNMIEYTIGEADPAYVTLTSLLHWKSDSETLMEQDLIDIYRRVFSVTTATPSGTRVVVKIIFDEANRAASAGGDDSLESKIILSIGARLSAERFMIQKLADPSFVAGIKAHQTQTLLAEFKRRFASHPALSVLDEVALMTPENIHLNSFMYEPILDMSADHLRRLYRESSQLT